MPNFRCWDYHTQNRGEAILLKNCSTPREAARLLIEEIFDPKEGFLRRKLNIQEEKSDEITTWFVDVTLEPVFDVRAAK